MTIADTLKKRRIYLACGVIAMLGGLVIVPVVSLLSPKPDKELTDDMFSCYHKEVIVETKESLGK